MVSPKKKLIIGRRARIRRGKWGATHLGVASALVDLLKKLLPPNHDPKLLQS